MMNASKSLSSMGEFASLKCGRFEVIASHHEGKEAPELGNMLVNSCCIGILREDCKGVFRLREGIIGDRERIRVFHFCGSGDAMQWEVALLSLAFEKTSHLGL